MDLFSSLAHFEFCSFGSGSDGNCYYIGHGDGALLIDAGLSMRAIRCNLKEISKDLSQIKGILVTHDHIDHIRGIEAATKHFKIPIYATAGTLKGIRTNRFTQAADSAYFNELEPGRPLVIAGFRVIPFYVSHDVEEAVGFYVENSSHKFCLATDLGYINDVAQLYLRNSNILVLESNYDDEMLATGPYPPYLQERIKSNRGHLSNNQASEFLSTHWSDSFSHVFLAHLSRQNNSAEKALETLYNHLKAKEIRPLSSTYISALERTKRSDLFRIETW